jgi:plastocyanin
MIRAFVPGMIPLLALPLLACEDTQPTIVTPNTVSTDMANIPMFVTDFSRSAVSSDMAVPAADDPPSASIDVVVGPGNSLSFAPQTVTINVGDTIRWVWATASMPYTVTSGATGVADGQFCSLPAGQPVNATTCNSANYAVSAPHTYEHRFDTVGTFPYFCEVHGISMRGMIIVQ